MPTYFSQIPPQIRTKSAVRSTVYPIFLGFQISFDLLILSEDFEEEMKIWFWKLVIFTIFFCYIKCQDQQQVQFGNQPPGQSTVQANQTSTGLRAWVDLTQFIQG